MSDSAALLRLLEPPVRPVGTPGGSAVKSVAPPIEQRSFEALLAEATGGAAAGAVESAAEASGEADGAERGNPLRGLGGFGAIENASLRGLMGRA